jgi:hypothetical protein
MAQVTDHKDVVGSAALTQERLNERMNAGRRHRWREATETTRAIENHHRAQELDVAAWSGENAGRPRRAGCSVKSVPMSQDSENNKKVTGPHRFKKGDKRPPGAGRHRGVPNRISLALKDAVIAAAELAGEKKWSKTTKSFSRSGPGGLLGYCLHLAKHNEAVFAPLLNKVLPLHTTSAVVNRNYRTESEVRQLCLERGIDFDSIMDLGEPMPRNMIDVTTGRD